MREDVRERIMGWFDMSWRRNVLGATVRREDLYALLIIAHLFDLSFLEENGHYQEVLVQLIRLNNLSQDDATIACFVFGMVVQHIPR